MYEKLQKPYYFKDFYTQNRSQQGSDTFHTNRKHLINMDIPMESFMASFEFILWELHLPEANP